ncbi:MAG: hypothetical protein AAF799_03005 [Myxococcota bacterium]
MAGNDDDDAQRGRRRIASIVHAPGEDGGDRLTWSEPAHLAAAVADESEPWWRRRTCVFALRDRIHEELVPPLWARVEDDGDVAEVRVALLDVLGSWWASQAGRASESRAKALTWLRGRNLDALSYGMDQAVILARCKLGDLEAVSALAKLAFDPWHHRIRTAEQGATALFAAVRLDEVLAVLGAKTVPELVTSGATAADRHFGLLCLAEGPPNPAVLIRALRDRNVVVAGVAARHLQDAEIDDEVLLAAFDEHADALRASASAPPPLTGRAAAAAWALIVASRRIDPQRLPARGEPECDARAQAIHERLDQLGDATLAHPAVPADVRIAILEAYLPGERSTDPRLLLEGLRLGHREDDAQPENPERAREALASIGLEVGEATEIGEKYQQGGGSYGVFDVSGGSVSVCTFGPFVRAVHSLPEAAITAVEQAGFRWIDDELAEHVFDGLPVYFFGSREPLRVSDLLFYWQD